MSLCSLKGFILLGKYVRLAILVKDYNLNVKAETIVIIVFSLTVYKVISTWMITIVFCGI